jgi:single-stranded-DNA-specific exonuclease
VIVLEDSQWHGGVLGLVAGQIAQEYGRPTILLSTELTIEDSVLSLARGSARSVNNIDLYQLVKSQEHLLHRFGGHPFAAGLSLPVENIPLFTESINQQLRQKLGIASTLMTPVVAADLVVKVADLGKELFDELKLLEPCGIGNPVPKLLIQNCWFEEVWNRNTQDMKGRKVQYIKTEFEIFDDSSSIGFPGIWWGHYKDEVPKGRCHAIVELDYNNSKKCPEVRLVAVQSNVNASSFNIANQLDWILDWRGQEFLVESSNQQQTNWQPATPLRVHECPISWDELQVWFRRAIQSERKLAIAYPPPTQIPPQEIWQKLVGIAKFLSRTGESANRAQLQEKLDLSDRTLHLGLVALCDLGFQIKHLDWSIQISWHPDPATSQLQVLTPLETTQVFLEAIAEEQFRRQYFYQVPLSTLQRMAAQTSFDQLFHI